LVYEKLANTLALPATNNPFRDTRNLDVLKAFNTQLMVGIRDDIFAPDDFLTREQAATVLTRVFKRATMLGWTLETDANFPLVFRYVAPFNDDAHISEWAHESVYFMASNGIITGFPDNTFRPRATNSHEEAAGFALATREQALTIALRMVQNLGR
jgi:hypothetical protein